jgi:hypothetical protein
MKGNYNSVVRIRFDVGMMASGGVVKHIPVSNQYLNDLLGTTIW